MEKIKIGFVANNLVVGGVSKVLIDLCNGLDQKIYDIHLLVLSNDLAMESIIPLKKSIHKHIIDYNFINDYSLLSYLKTAFINKTANRKRAENVVQVISKLNLDILHFHTLPRQLYIGQLAKENDSNLQLVFTDHLVRLSPGDYNWYQKFLMELAYRKFYTDYNTIAVSKAVFNSIKQSKRFDSSYKFELLENSISISDYKRTKPLESFSENRFIYISRMNHHKGQETLIKAWKLLNNPEKGKLILVGPDESDGKFHKLAADDSSIEFTGSVSNVKEVLNDANFAIFPSQKEGLPIALLEMMAFELPIIVSDIPELTSIIEDKKQGLHFKLDDEEDLVKKIDYFIYNKAKAIEMGLNAKQKVIEICRANNPQAFHNSFYHSILSQ